MQHVCFVCRACRSISKALHITCTHISHDQTQTHAHSHASDVKLEFGVESQVDEGSGDLHPPASP